MLVIVRSGFIKQSNKIVRVEARERRALVSDEW